VKRASRKRTVRAIRAQSTSTESTASANGTESENEQWVDEIDPNEKGKVLFH